MREIKFRAWDTQANCMLGGGGMQMNATTGRLERLPAVVVMQYTGLKDKNSKPIYEGDIVSRFRQDIHKNKIESRYPVCFGLYDNGKEYEDWIGGNGWYLGQELFFRSDKREAGGWESKCKHLLDADELEVIGNIYENPDGEK